MGDNRTRVIRKSQGYLYADISLEFSLKRKEEIPDREFKLILLSALKSLHGDSGASKSVDILKYRPQDMRAYIRFNPNDLVYLRSSLTLFSEWKGSRCAFRFHKFSHSLSSLSIESFYQQHHVVENC
jgi:RNase P/RNase MRP subunit POP5